MPDGPTDKHAGGWAQSNVLPEHRFLRVGGGLLSVSVSAGADPKVTMRRRDVHGTVVNEDMHPSAK